MKLEVVEKTFLETYKRAKVFQFDALIEDYDLISQTKKEILHSDEFLEFLKSYDTALRKEIDEGWSILNEGYNRFMKNPYVNGDANIIDEIDWYFDYESIVDNQIYIFFTIPVQVGIYKDDIS